jgi:hypothetical protein
LRAEYCRMKEAQEIRSED